MIDEQERARIREEQRIRNSQTLKTSLKWLGIVALIVIIGVSGCTYAVFHSMFSHPFSPS